ncbi:hypothetical protein BXQ17_04410 [Polaribacter sp. BM10]|uniref:sensor histidine kinase n=1 Tax=Polaribacter sp. BM10 TaxID=1529069 RepID=UPI00098B0EAE|nr:histidine kinase [Polaribacter sp. BM10]AQS93371.1 hypothetical protein BXQ17_04410 [Polaribacter sp. BM10]
MKRKVRLILVSLVVYLIIILSSHIISKSLNNYEKDDFFRVYVTSFIIIFLPVSISIFTFRKNQKSNFYIKAPLISFGLVFVAIYLYFSKILLKESYSFLEFTTLMNSLIGFFISLLFNFLLLIKSKYADKNVKLFLKVSYSIKKILIIALTTTIIYSILIILGSASFTKLIFVWTTLFPFGLLFAFLTITFLNNFQSNNLFKIIILYLLVILLFDFLTTLPLMTRTYEITFSNRLYLNILLSIALFSPYYLCIVLLTHLYFLKLVSKQEKTFLIQQSIESQLNYQQLKNQISPHFLFNNINVLTSLIEENPTKAVSFSENLSNIYRYFLEQEKQDVVLVKDEIEFAKSYLELLKERFEIGFNYLISVDESVNDKYIVSTILQQVLENVVKHNIINENNIVDVKITSEENYLIVENNKIPKSVKIENSKKGIENIIQRIAYFTDDKVIIKKSETHFVIQLPILETV